MREREETVRSGTWIYDSKIECHVKIVRSRTVDHLDYPDGSSESDAEMSCFYVLWGSPVESGKFSSEVGHFITLPDAVAYVEKVTNEQVRWEDAAGT